MTTSVPPTWRRRGGRFLLVVAFLLLWPWTAGMLRWGLPLPTVVGTVLALVWLVAWPLAWWRLRDRRRAVEAWFLIATGVAVTGWQFVRPSTDRDWAPEVANLPQATFDGPVVTIENVRDCRWSSRTEGDLRYATRTYDLRELERVEFMVEPFGPFVGPAHTLLTFGFADGRWLAISVEVRRAAGESYSPFAGLYRNYELCYVVGDERDLLLLRTNQRRDTVRLYPLRTTRERARALLRSMLERANHLRAVPEFYNTLTSTCTTNLVDHVNELVPERVPFSWKTLLPAHADTLALELGLLDTDLTLEAARARFRVDAIAQRLGDDGDFSRRLRAVRDADGSSPR